MLGLVTLTLIAGANVPAVLHVGSYSPALLALYLLALRSVHVHERASRAHAAQDMPTHAAAVTRPQWRRFGMAAAVVVVAGSLLPEIADALAEAAGLSRSFVGTVFMSLATTLPEMAVTLAALRLGALDMAIGNLLGSNLFNVLILAIDDAAYTAGPLLQAVDAMHAATAVTASVMTGLVIVGLVMRPRGRVLRVLTWISVGLLSAYVINAALLYVGAP